ncbi:hypothetical protein CF319_g8336 [Tilletia indica]|nr:hypothetical protein CF319_g8336 [Tilletia indica]
MVYRVQTLCVCYFKCKRRARDPGRVVNVAVRNRHRKRDAATFETRAYDGLHPPAMLIQARQDNHHKSFRVEVDVGDRTSANGASSIAGGGHDAPGSTAAVGREASLGVGAEDEREHGEQGDAGLPSSASVGDTGPLVDDSGGDLSSAPIGDTASFLDDGRDEDRRENVEATVQAFLSDIQVNDDLNLSDVPQDGLSFSFLELSGEAEVADGLAMVEEPTGASMSMALDGDLEEEVGEPDPMECDDQGGEGDVDASVSAAATGDTYGVVAVVHTFPMGPLTLTETVRLERLLERIRLEEEAAIRLAPTLTPLGVEFLRALLCPLDLYEYVPRDDSPPPIGPECSRSNAATLDLLAAWQTTGGTVQNYVAFGLVLQKHAKVKIKTLYLARQLVEETSGLTPIAVDMCPASCVGFTGPRQHMTHCPMCGLARYRYVGARRTQVAVKTYNYVPYLPRLRAYFGNEAWSRLMRYWGQRGRATEDAFSFTDGLATSCEAGHVFGDLCDGMSHIRHRQHGRFLDDREVAVAISTDGAQLLSNRRNSSAWLVLVQTLNLPPSLRFAVDHQHVSLIVPGPGAPKDLDSFLWPLFSEIASLSEHGTMVWDGSQAEWFRLRVHLLGVFADQPASAKVSHFVGGCGLYGCRFCTIRAVRNETSGHAVYFPLAAKLRSHPLNQGRQSYVPSKLPLRTVDQYRLAVARLATSQAVGRRRAVGTSTGIARLPPISFSASFHPIDFFPLDPFHLFNFNVPRTMWKALIGPQAGEFGFSEEQRTQFGAFIASNAKSYPVSFSSRAPRDISLFSNTGYKMVEWGSVFHHFLPAFLHFVGAPLDVRCMLDTFLQGVDLAMDRRGLTLSQIGDVERHFTSFVTEWERLYVASDAAISRATISIHLLLHVSDQLLTLGSVRATSQATCERMIGVLKQGVTAFRSPYAVMANRALSRAQVTLSGIRLGDKSVESREPDSVPALSFPIHDGHAPLTQEDGRQQQILMATHMTADRTATCHSYGRLVLTLSGDGVVVRGSRVGNADNRCCDNVEAVVKGSTCYFHVLHFNSVTTSSSRRSFALVRRFVVEETCPMFLLGSWGPSVELIPVASIVGIVAALALGEATYVVRRSTWQQDPIFSSDTGDAE